MPPAATLLLSLRSCERCACERTAPTTCRGGRGCWMAASSNIRYAARTSPYWVVKQLSHVCVVLLRLQQCQPYVTFSLRCFCAGLSASHDGSLCATVTLVCCAGDIRNYASLTLPIPALTCAVLCCAVLCCAVLCLCRLVSKP
jgi:hypothetical protein